jgi:hypothetical protein
MSEYEDEDYERQQLDYLRKTIPEFDIPPSLCELTFQSLELNRVKRLTVKGTDLAVRFTDKEVINLIEMFSAAQVRLEEISLPFHRITDVGFEEILRLLKPALFAESQSSQTRADSALLSINLEGNDINGDFIDNSPLVSKYECSLLSLNLSSNPLSSKGQYAIANMILNNQVLKHLIVDSCGFELNELILLSSNLSQNDSLQTLSINRPILNKIKEELVIDHFHRVLISNRSLMNLSLKYYKIMDFGAKLLSDSLLRNNSLMSLNLECNCINVAGAEAIASYLIMKNNSSNSNRCLEFLGLAYNKVSDDGAIALAEVSMIIIYYCFFSNFHN